MKDVENKIYWMIASILAVIPIIIGIIYISKYGVNVPFLDQWFTVPSLLDELFEGKLTIFELFEQHNESRMPFPLIIMLVLAYVTKYNILYEISLSYILYTSSFLILFLMYKNDQGINRLSLLKFVPISWFFFNLCQMGNMLFGIQISQSLMILMFLGSVYLIDSSSEFDKRFLISVGTAVVASFSFIAGLSVWPACMIQIILQDSAQKLRKITIWGFTGALIYIIYFYNFAKPGSHPSFLYSLYNPYDGLLCFIYSVGSTISHQSILSQISGILILVILVSILTLNKSNLHLSKNSKWISLILFSLFASLEITISRSGLAPWYSLSQRYLLLTFFSIIGLYCLVLNLLDIQNLWSNQINPEKKRGNWYLNYLIFGLIITLMITGISSHLVPGIEFGKSLKESREEMAYYLETYTLQPDKNLAKLCTDYPSAVLVREKAQFLERQELSVFAKEKINIKELPELKGNTYSSIEVINDMPIYLQKEPIIVNKGDEEEILVTGWAVDETLNEPASAVFITIDDTINIPAKYGLDRPDVANVYKNGNFRYSGFKASFASSLLENGPHNLTIRIVSRNKCGYYKSGQNVKFIVK